MIHLDEMANCRPKKTGIPMNIWIDETEAYKRGRHSKRIKFQINKNPKFQPSNSCSMLLDGSIPEKQEQQMYLSKDFDLKIKDIEEVRNFVLNNAYALDKIADQKLDLDDFWGFAIIGGNKASEEEKEFLRQETNYFLHL